MIVAENQSAFGVKNTCTKQIFDFKVESCAQPKIISDHLGSRRVTLTETGAIDSWSDYYPFGKEARSSVSVNKPRENFTGHQLDGESSLIYAGARYYNQDIGKWLGVDPMSNKRMSVSPYNYCRNNPIFNTDPDGAEDGHYYQNDGTYLGTDGIQDDKVYVADGVTDNIAVNAKELSVSHTEFQKQAATVYGESSVGWGITNKEEMFAIASTHQKNKIAYGANNNAANTFTNTALSNRTGAMATANAAVINAITGGFDYSNGASQWDGQDQARIPAGNKDLASSGGIQYKMNVMGWKISDSHYSSWKTAINNKFGEGSFTAPQSKTALYDYSGMSNKGKTRLESTAQYGLTIFWKELP